MSSSDEIVGRTLGHFRVLERIGAGGMGVVYRARDEHLDRDVALKVLPAGTLQDEAARRSFRREALALSKLNHPNIETVHDFDSEDGVDFLIIEHIAGVALDERLASGALPEKETLRLGQQLAEGVAAAHRAGIVHRDLKPANLRITPDGRMKILDFGLAGTVSGQEVTAAQTQSLAIAGTLPYMAPEQLVGGSVDARSDVWGIGVILYEMVAGRRPFDQPTAPLIAGAILTQAPDSPARNRRGVSPVLEHVVMKCLEKDPEDRYQSAAEIAVDLRRLAKPSSAIPAEPTRPSHRRSRASLAVAAAVIAALAVAAGMVLSRSGRARPRPAGGGAPRIESLAVLPLTNLSGDTEQEYFSDGMTEALITELAQLEQLTVISRTSVMQYRATRKTMPEIARELNVDGVIEGSVQRSGDRVGINVQLIHGATDRHLWAKGYERDLRDVLALQREIARAIVAELQVELTPREKVRLTSSRPVVPAAYDAVLKGFHHGRKLTREGGEKAREYFQQALSLDPNYAPAHAGLAYYYMFDLGDWYVPNKDVFPRAKEAALKAIELDPSLPEAHTFLAMTLFIHDLDWTGAEQELRRALELNPGSADAREWYGVYLGALGRFEPGTLEIRRALELAPLSAEANHMLGMHFYYARRYDDAIEQLRRTLELDPNYFWAEMVLGQTLEQKRQFREAAAAFERARRLTEEAGEAPPEILAGLARSQALAGHRREALETFSKLRALRERRYISPFDVAIVHAALDEKELALDWLEKAYDDRNWWLPWLGVDPRLDPLRSEPRFQRLILRMAYPR